MKKMTVAVIGGGAAGMMAGIVAAANGAGVTLFEGGERVGRKILSTGNGKCNLGNTSLDVSCYNGPDKKWLESSLSQFDTEKTISFFESIGLYMKEKNGYLYPLSEQASAVLDVLRNELHAKGVTVLCGEKVTNVIRTGDGFAVRSVGGERKFDRVILACGSKAAPFTGSDGSGYKLAARLGHHLTDVVPALVALRCEEAFLREIAGVRITSTIRIPELAMEETGELQLVDYGISGIPVFQLSRFVNMALRGKGKNSTIAVTLDFLPDISMETWMEQCNNRLQRYENRTVEECFTGILNKKIMHLFIRLAGLKRDVTVGASNREKLLTAFALCKEFRLHVNGSNPYENAQVCAGGVDTAQVLTTMESKIVPGLYFAGELLDVDGRCGGYNLQWAWCSGFLAGKNAAGE